MGILDGTSGFGQAIGQIANVGYKLVSQKEAAKIAKSQAKEAQAAAAQAKAEAESAALASRGNGPSFAPIAPATAARPFDPRLLYGGAALLAVALLLKRK